jgi:hypothetical protein
MDTSFVLPRVLVAAICATLATPYVGCQGTADTDWGPQAVDELPPYPDAGTPQSDDAGPPSQCGPEGATCSSFADCCSEACVEGFCAAPCVATGGQACGVGSDSGVSSSGGSSDGGSSSSGAGSRSSSNSSGSGGHSSSSSSSGSGGHSSSSSGSGSGGHSSSSSSSSSGGHSSSSSSSSSGGHSSSSGG